MNKARKRKVKRQSLDKLNQKRLAERRSSTPSKGEQKIINYLKKKKIRYTREWTCNSLKFAGYSLFMDFYLRDYKVFVEYDGIQHYEPTYGKSRLKKQQEFDKFKDRWCKSHGKDLLRIKYTNYSRIASILYKYLKDHCQHV